MYFRSVYFTDRKAIRSCQYPVVVINKLFHIKFVNSYYSIIVPCHLGVEHSGAWC